MNTAPRKNKTDRTPVPDDEDGANDDLPAARAADQSAADADVDLLTFEQAMERLQEIVSELQRNELPLERGIERYEEAMRYAKRCRATLRRAERKVERLTGIGPDGEAKTTSFEDQGEGEDLAEKAARRSARRSVLTPGTKPKSEGGPSRGGRSDELFE